MAGEIGEWTGEIIGELSVTEFGDNGGELSLLLTEK